MYSWQRIDITSVFYTLLPNQFASLAKNRTLPDLPKSVLDFLLFSAESGLFRVLPRTANVFLFRLEENATDTRSEVFH